MFCADWWDKPLMTIMMMMIGAWYCNVVYWCDHPSGKKKAKNAVLSFFSFFFFLAEYFNICNILQKVETLQISSSAQVLLIIFSSVLLFLNYSGFCKICNFSLFCLLQYSPSDPTKVMVTSSDSQVRILDGPVVISKYRGNESSFHADFFLQFLVMHFCSWFYTSFFSPSIV